MSFGTGAVKPGSRREESRRSTRFWGFRALSLGLKSLGLLGVLGFRGFRVWSYWYRLLIE